MDHINIELALCFDKIPSGVFSDACYKAIQIGKPIILKTIGKSVRASTYQTSNYYYDGCCGAGSKIFLFFFHWLNIAFEIQLGNANPISTESFQLPQHKAWQGKCLVIIKSNKKAGEIILKATGDGLKTVEIKLRVD